MTTHPFHLVDVFAEEKYAGNQLAVIRNARDLAEIEMQKIAREMNYSETTFVISDRESLEGYDVRIFTPEREIPFAGHPTLGTAYVILNEILKKPVESIVLNLKVGQIPVMPIYKVGTANFFWMRQMIPEFLNISNAETIAPTLGLDLEDIDMRFPVQEVSTGLPFTIVPLKKLRSLRRARTERKSFAELQTGSAKSFLLFCPETYERENQLNVRVFADSYGIPEDPATGSANGCLAGYLVKHRYFCKDKIDIRVEQGHEIGRPSLLHLRAEDKQGRLEVHIGGRVVPIARGELL